MIKTIAVFVLGMYVGRRMIQSETIRSSLAEMGEEEIYDLGYLAGVKANKITVLGVVLLAENGSDRKRETLEARGLRKPSPKNF